MLNFTAMPNIPCLCSSCLGPRLSFDTKYLWRELLLLTPLVPILSVSGRKHKERTGCSSYVSRHEVVALQASHKLKSASMIANTAKIVVE